VWQVNIPHTHLAHEKSDQNWMVVKGDKIEFPGGGTHFHYGADKYIASLANVSLIQYNTTEGNLDLESVYTSAVLSISKFNVLLITTCLLMCSLFLSFCLFLSSFEVFSPSSFEVDLLLNEVILLFLD